MGMMCVLEVMIAFSFVGCVRVRVCEFKEHLNSGEALAMPYYSDLSLLCLQKESILKTKSSEIPFPWGCWKFLVSFLNKCYMSLYGFIECVLNAKVVNRCLIFPFKILVWGFRVASKNSTSFPSWFRMHEELRHRRQKRKWKYQPYYYQNWLKNLV